MKKFGILIILTALGLYGSAFFGIYTAPGLEEFPNAKSLGLKYKGSGGKGGSGSKVSAGTIDPIERTERPAAALRTNPNGAAAQRNAYLHANEEKVAPKRK